MEGLLSKYEKSLKSFALGQKVKGKVLEITPKGFKLLERAPGVSVEDIIKATEADLIIEGEIPEMSIN